MSRELSRRRRPAPQERTLLSDLARLPLEAAVDMVCVGLDAAPSVGPLADRGLTELTQRVEAAAHESPERAAGCALRVIAALAQLEPAQLPEARVQCAQALAAVALHAGATVGPLVLAAVTRPERLGTALLEPVLQRTRRDAAARADAVDTLTSWGQRELWREHRGADARDGLASALVEQSVARAELAEAARVASVWPPMRTALTRLGAALAGAGDLAALSQLAASYDPRGALWRALIDHVAQVAASRGATGESVAAWVFAQDPSEARFRDARTCTDARVWPARRAALVGTVLDREEAPWLAALLAEEADAVQALSQVISTHGRRPRTVDAALAMLSEVSPRAAFALQSRLLLAQVRSGSATVRGVQRGVKALQACADALGEGALARSWLDLVRRELGEDTPALRALVGQR